AESGASSSSAVIGITRAPAIATGTVAPFTRASARWKGSGMGGAARGAALDHGRHGDGEHERPAVEDLVDPARQARELQADDPGLQEVDADQRADRVELARLDDGGAEEYGGEGGQQIGVGDVGVIAAEARGHDDPGHAADRARGDVGAEPDAVDV